MAGRKTQIEVLEQILKSINDGNKRTHELLQNLIDKMDGNNQLDS